MMFSSNKKFIFILEGATKQVLNEQNDLYLCLRGGKNDAVGVKINTERVEREDTTPRKDARKKYDTRGKTSNL